MTESTKSGQQMYDPDTGKAVDSGENEETTGQTGAESGDEVTTTEVPVQVPNPLFQTAPVDTSGVGGLPDLGQNPVFAAHRAETMQRALDQVSGDAPKNKLVHTDEVMPPEKTDALIETLTYERDRAQAIADGEIPEEGEQGSPEGQAAETEGGPRGPGVSAEAQSATAQQSARSESGSGSASQSSSQSGSQSQPGQGRTGTAEEEGTSNRPV